MNKGDSSQRRVEIVGPLAPTDAVGSVLPGSAGRHRRGVHSGHRGARSRAARHPRETHHRSHRSRGAFRQRAFRLGHGRHQRGVRTRRTHGSGPWSCTRGRAGTARGIRRLGFPPPSAIPAGARDDFVARHRHHRRCRARDRRRPLAGECGQEREHRSRRGRSRADPPLHGLVRAHARGPRGSGGRAGASLSPRRARARATTSR